MICTACGRTFATCPCVPVTLNAEYARRLIAAWCRAHPDQIEGLAEMGLGERLDSIVLVILDKWLLENSNVQR